MKWYIELPLFALTFFGVTVIFNTLFNLRFNFVTELFTALVFYGVYKYLGRKMGIIKHKTNHLMLFSINGY